MTVNDICTKFKWYISGAVCIVHKCENGGLDETDVFSPIDVEDETPIDTGVVYGQLKNADVLELSIDADNKCLEIWI